MSFLPASHKFLSLIQQNVKFSSSSAFFASGLGNAQSNLFSTSSISLLAKDNNKDNNKKPEMSKKDEAAMKGIMDLIQKEKKKKEEEEEILRLKSLEAEFGVEILDQTEEKKAKQILKKKGVKEEEEEEKKEKETREKPKREKEAHPWFARTILALFFGLNGYIFYTLIKRRKKDKKDRVDTVSSWGELLKIYTKPASERLLPDRPKNAPAKATIVICVEDFLTRQVFDYEGLKWRVQVRPGAFEFLEHLSQHFEVVLFSDQPMGIMAPVVQKLDRQNGCHKLFKDAMLFSKGKLVKDLTYMNRPLEKIILVDHNQDYMSKQRENSIPVQKWEGENDDFLEKFGNFFHKLSKINFSDYRTGLAQLGAKSGEELVKKFEKKPEQKVKPTTKQ